MAVHALADRATAGATSRWTSCTHADRHIVGHIDLVNDQVGKIGKYRHRLILDQKTASLEILFGSLVYHMPSSGLRKNQDMLHNVPECWPAFLSMWVRS